MARRGRLRIGAWLALMPLASAFMAPALPALPGCASPLSRETASPHARARAGRRWHPGGAQLTVRLWASRCVRGNGAGAFARLHNRILYQPRMGLLDDMRAANAERMAINEGKNLVGSKYGVKTLQAFPCRVLKEDWKADKLSGMLQVRPRQPVGF